MVSERECAERERDERTQERETETENMRPAVGPSYGLFVERSAEPIDNPARTHWPLPTVHTTRAQNQIEDLHEPVFSLLTTNVPQPKLVAKLTL